MQFGAQAEAERARGLPVSMPCSAAASATSPAAAASELGFIDVVAAPVFKALGCLEPRLGQLLCPRVEATRRRFAALAAASGAVQPRRAAQ